ncbi:hypothetical protein CC80DRAFT_410754, partial [Byssothecium circinans]
WELLALVLSITSFIAVIVVLQKYDKQPRTKWTMPVPINTMIAILATISRTTLAFAMSACLGQQKWNWLRRRSDHLVAFLRFDEASRGPMGASRLFFFLKFRHWAVLGALVTIGSLAFDPFIQAALSTRGQLDELMDDASTTLGQSLGLDFGNMYNPFPPGFVVVTPEIGRFSTKTLSTYPDIGVVSSIYDGFGATTPAQKNTSTLAFNCRTGNCTWSAYSSTAICSSCIDVSASLATKRQFNNSTAKIPARTTYSVPYALIVNRDGPITCKINDTREADKLKVVEAKETLMVWNTIIDPNQTLNFQNHTTMLLSILVIKACDDYLFHQAPWNTSRPNATESALHLYANIYTNTVQDGTLKETILQSHNQKVPGS